jgi:hypothetical protein
MSETADIAARTQRFNQAARIFTPPSPSRHAKLMPLKDGIVELRQKGASLRLIRELLATVDVAVGTDTIARFLSEVNGDQAPQRPSRRSGHRRAAARNPAGGRTGVVPVTTDASPPAQAPAQPPRPEPRTRGPRVADLRNL